MAAGVAAAQGDQDVVGREPAMHEALLGQRVRPLAVLLLVLAVAVLADALHALDRALGCANRKSCACSRVQPASATMRMCSGARITTLWPERDAAVIGHGVGDRAQDLLGRVAAVVLDVAEAAAGEAR